jgi:predicted transcriptional regulator
MAHIVTGPLVITKKEDGSDLYLYQGSEVPDFVSADEIKRLVDIGLVDKVTKAQADASDAPIAESN